MTERFVIWGGYGGNNLGDEAILWALSRLLRKLQPQAEVYVLIPDGVPEFAKLQYDAWGIGVVSGKMPGCLGILRRARLIVGGGQMVDDTTLAWPVGWSSVFLGINSFSRQKPLVLCVGAEPLRHPLTRFLVRNFYSKAMVCTCRDDESAAVMREVGVSPSKVWVTRDVVFSLDRGVVPQYSTGGRGTSPTVALVIAHDPNRVVDTIERYTALIDNLLARQVSVTVVAHDLRADYDIRARDEIMSRYKDCAGLTAIDTRTVDEVLAIYSRSEAVISARMHPLILGSLCGTLPIAFGGKAKVRSLIQLANIPEIIAKEADGQAQEVVGFLRQRTQRLPAIAAAMEGFRTIVEDVTRKALAL